MFPCSSTFLVFSSAFHYLCCILWGSLYLMKSECLATTLPNQCWDLLKENGRFCTCAVTAVIRPSNSEGSGQIHLCASHSFSKSLFLHLFVLELRSIFLANVASLIDLLVIMHYPCNMFPIFEVSLPSFVLFQRSVSLFLHNMASSIEGSPISLATYLTWTIVSLNLVTNIIL